MTKTLTEQWREGTLPDGKYYIKLEPNFAERYDVGYSEGGGFCLYNTEDIEEVLAPVPSYDEYNELATKCHQLEKELVLNKLEPIHLHNCLARISELEEKNKNARKRVKKLQEQMKIATKALEHYANTNTWCMCNKLDCAYVDGSVACIALKEMEGVK